MSGLNVTADFESSLDQEAVAGVAQKTLGPYSKEKAEKILEISQGLVPVATGTLQASGHVATVDVALIAETNYQIVYDAPTTDQSKWKSYAIFVEMGTVKMSAQPYLRPAIDQASTE
jgi:HK97 gp10 family phage protein